MKYRKELIPNIQFQPDKTFIRNDLFGRIIKSCKAANAEFLMLKEKLGICPYEKNYNEEDIIKIQDDIEETDKKSTKKLIKGLSKELSKKLSKESDKESDEESDEASDEELIEMISPKNDESTTDWYDKNKFNKILTNIDSNKFNHKNKIGKLKFNDINNLVNNIKNNVISEAHAKQKLNALNGIKKAEIKNKRLINGQKNLLKLFDELIEAIFNNKSVSNIDDNVSVNESVNESENENENDNGSKNENESIDKIDDNDVCVNKDDNDNESESGDEQYYKIKQLNNYFRTIDETKSFEEQIEILKKEIF